MRKVSTSPMTTLAPGLSASLVACSVLVNPFGPASAPPTGTRVGFLPSAGLPLSSLGSDGKLLPLATAWFARMVPSGVPGFTLARYETVAAAPGASVPRFTLTGVSLSTTPWLVTTDPGTTVVLFGVGSFSRTSVALVAPEFRTMMV